MTKLDDNLIDFSFPLFFPSPINDLDFFSIQLSSDDAFRMPWRPSARRVKANNLIMFFHYYFAKLSLNVPHNDALFSVE